jgi:uncharacterized protein (TIGR02145 family)
LVIEPDIPRAVKTSFFISLLLLSSFISGFSQTPELINYQAVARNSDGSPIADTQIGVMISILDGSEHGPVLYSEKHQVYTSSLGLFDLKIGEGSGTDDFSSIGWGSGTGFWMQVKIDRENNGNFMLMGSSRLVSVPFALYAQEAATAEPVLRSLTDQERDALENPAEGMMILNKSNGSLNIYQGGSWWQADLHAISQEWSCGKSFTDTRNNRTYKTALIGNKCWMAENLNVGQLINISTQQTNNGTIEKYCYDNNEENCSTYGALYQWDEAMNYSGSGGSPGICPEGWHLPTDQEWQQMEISLGMSATDAALSNTWRGTDQGTQMAVGGSSHYDALYSGRSVPGFGFTALTTYEYVWTSDASGGNAWRRCLSTVDPKVGRYNTFPKSYGMSVRCVK